MRLSKTLVKKVSMKILYIANARMPTEKAHGIQIMKTCEAFAELGHEVELILPWRFNPIKEDIYEYYNVKKNFKIKKIPSLDLIWAGKIGFWIQSFTFAETASWYALLKKSDAIYSRDELPLFNLCFFKKNTFWETHTGRYNFIVKHLLKKCAGIIAITEGLRDFYTKNGVDFKKIVVAADAVDIINFSKKYVQADVRKKLGLPLDKKIALYVGRLDGWKGLETALEASKLLPAEIQMVIIGGEEKQAARFKKEYPNVIFLGFRPYRELAENLAAADVLLLPNTGKNEISARFTSPLKLFAYMASKKPIIASDLPSIREILCEENAYLVAPDDGISLAEAIKNTLNQEDISESKANRAYQDVQKYTWRARADKIINFIKQWK